MGMKYLLNLNVVKLTFLLSIVLALPNEAWTQNGPVKSNLSKVLFYFYGFSADHANTIQYASYLKNLGTTHGFTVDTTRSPTVFNAANLANYQVIILFSALYFGVNMTAAQKSAVEAFQASNKGMACFHQCVRNQWGGNYPNWYDSLMGVQYNTFAGFGTGPVYLNSDVVGTDLAMGITASGTTNQYEADYTQSWDDEWYTYLANPKPQALGAATKIIWTTKRSAHSFGSSFTVTGETQAMAWAREVKGGRFILNSLFHRDMPRTSTIAPLRQFIDGQIIGTMRYLAGYTGCKDPKYVEYNPKATHQGAGACLTSIATGIIISAFSQGEKNQGLQVSINTAGAHSVRVYHASGKLVEWKDGVGPYAYEFPSIRKPGIYFVKTKTSRGTFTKRMNLL
jgi:hypothetical protein